MNPGACPPTSPCSRPAACHAEAVRRRRVRGAVGVIGGTALLWACLTGHVKAEDVPIGGGCVVRNQIVNGDFEAGPNWGGSTTAPYGWTQGDSSASPYTSPSTGADAIGGSGRSLVMAFNPNRQTTDQVITETGGEWMFRADFTVGDPQTGQDGDTLVILLNRADSTVIFFKIEDDGPDDGTAEIVVRNPELDILTIPNLFDADPLTTPLTHQLTLIGHFDDPVPNYDVIITRNDTMVFSALGQTRFSTAPAVGSGIDKVRLVGSNWETSYAVVDNVALGTVVKGGQPGFVVIDGQNTLPLCWQAFQPQSGTTHYSRLQIDECREHGYDALMTYYAMQFGSDFQMLMHLDQAHERGVKVIVDVHSVSDDEVVRRVNVVKDHPALFGYYLADEPELVPEMTPQRLISAYAALKSADADPAHPVLSAYALPIASVEPYLPATDIVLRELFTLNGIFDTTPLLQVPDDLAVAAAHGKWGYMGMPRAYQGGITNQNLAQFKYSVLAPISMGAGGLIHHIFEGFVPPETFAVDPDWRYDVAYPVTDLLAAIRPIMLSSTGSVGATSLDAGANNVTFVIGGTSDNAVLIAAHNADTTVSDIGFDLANIDPTISQGGVLTESRSVSLTNGSFMDDFGPWAVHVYRLATVALPGGGSRTTTVSGTVELQDFSGNVTTVPVVIEVRDPGLPSVLERHEVTLASDGAYAFTTECKGMHDIAAKASHWARQVRPDIDTTSDVTVDVALANGDCDQDGIIRLADKVCLEAALGSGTGDPNWDAECDLNGDDQITAADRSILESNLVFPDLEDALIVSTDIETDVQIYLLDGETLSGLAGHARRWFDRVSGITAQSDGGFALISGGSHVTRLSLMSPWLFEDVNDSTVRIGYRSNTTSGLGAGGAVNRFDEIFAAEDHGNFSGGATYAGCDPGLPILSAQQGGAWDHMVQHHAGDVLSNGDFVLTIDGSMSYSGDTGFEWRRRDLTVQAERVTSGFNDIRGLAVSVNDTIALMDQDTNSPAATLFRRTTNPAAGTSVPAGHRTYPDAVCGAVESLADGTWVFAVNTPAGTTPAVYLLSDADPVAELDATTLPGVSNITCLAVQSDDDIIVGTDCGRVVRLSASLDIQCAVEVFDPVTHIAALRQPASPATLGVVLIFK